MFEATANSSSSQHLGTTEWAVFSTFAFLWLCSGILFVILAVAKRGIKWVLGVLVIGWTVRCIGLVRDVNGDTLSNIAGLLFFSSCCLVLLQLILAFHEQRDCPGSFYRSFKWTLAGYNAFFYALELCTAIGAFIAGKSMDPEAGREAELLISKILSVLFGMSFIFLVVAYIGVAYILRSSIHYLRFIIPFYIVNVVCLLFRVCVNIASVFSDLSNWIDVTTNNNIGAIFQEAIPGAMLLIIIALCKSPWDGPYMPLSQMQNEPGSEEKLTMQDLFHDPEINLIPREALIQVDVVGSGSVATVYKCSYKSNLVALKVFHLTVSEMTKTQTAAIAREVKLMSALAHPNIVTMYGVTWTPEGQLGIVSELVELGSLKTVLPLMYRDMHWSLRLRMALDIARGMNFIHSRNVIHRYLKSSNVLVTKILQIKIADMGLSCLTSEMTGELGTGTIEYFAPEVLHHRAFSPKSDVYSFGVILYELATGRPPFTECSLAPTEMRAAIESGRLSIRPSPACPKPVAELIIRCTSIDADSRPLFSEIERKVDALRNSAGSLQDPYSPSV